MNYLSDPIESILDAQDYDYEGAHIDLTDFFLEYGESLLKQHNKALPEKSLDALGRALSNELEDPEILELCQAILH